MLKDIKIKVCGLTIPDQIHQLMEIKIDFLGFIFYDKSPRYVLNHLTLNDLESIKFSSKVGVFVNETIENVESIARKVHLKYIQLHGEEDEAYVQTLKSKLPHEVKMIKAIRVGAHTEHLSKHLSTFALTDYFLFDTDSKAYGGTGQSFDWELLNTFTIPKPYFLSGGVSEENYKNVTLLKQVPFAFDINSKFELQPGDKDLNKIINFKHTISI